MLREIRWEKTKAPEGPGLRTQEFIGMIMNYQELLRVHMNYQESEFM